MKYVLYQEFQSQMDLTEELQNLKSTCVQQQGCEVGWILRSVDAPDTFILESHWTSHPIETPPHFAFDRYRCWTFEVL